MERHCLQIIRNESAYKQRGEPDRRGGTSGLAVTSHPWQYSRMTDTSDIGPAREAFLALQRKARKRKADRDRIKRKTVRNRPVKARNSAPETYTPRDWPAEDKARWVNALSVWLTNGGSLRGFVKQYPQGPSVPCWYDWFQADAIIADTIARARENGADTLAEETVAIADSVRDAGQFDSARVNAARLAVDARKWVASKLKPKTYADRLETVTSGALTVTHTVSDEDRAKFLASMVARQTIAKAPNLVEAQRMIEAQAIDVTPEKTASKDGPSQ